MVKTLQAADLKTGSAIVGDTPDPGSEFAISDRYLTKSGNKRAGRGCGSMWSVPARRLHLTLRYWQ
jgi:hypothetical protein